MLITVIANYVALKSYIDKFEYVFKDIPKDIPFNKIFYRISIIYNLTVMSIFV